MSGLAIPIKIVKHREELEAPLRTIKTLLQMVDRNRGPVDPPHELRCYVKELQDWAEILDNDTSSFSDWHGERKQGKIWTVSPGSADFEITQLNIMRCLLHTIDYDSSPPGLVARETPISQHIRTAWKLVTAEVASSSKKKSAIWGEEALLAQNIHFY